MLIPWNKQYVPKCMWITFVKQEFSLMRAIFITNKYKTASEKLIFVRCSKISFCVVRFHPES